MTASKCSAFSQASMGPMRLANRSLRERCISGGARMHAMSPVSSGNTLSRCRRKASSLREPNAFSVATTKGALAMASSVAPAKVFPASLEGSMLVSCTRMGSRIRQDSYAALVEVLSASGKATTGSDYATASLGALPGMLSAFSGSIHTDAKTPLSSLITQAALLHREPSPLDASVSVPCNYYS